ncbi:MAG TPA: nucleoside-diphosphate kinase [Candidatus Thermoplasmatota archaeon]|nr:nucleoside-diphosphate kinase [Candidatus Thermoplasmatota archaeon]
MAQERTLILLKPDAVARGLAGTIIDRFERKGLTLEAVKLVQVEEALARKHYAEHEGRPFFPGLLAYIQSGPVLAMVIEGKDAVAVCRTLIGATDPKKAAPGTIRGDLAMDIGRNLVHGSDSPESARREIDLWFKPGENARAKARDWIYE